MDQTTVVIFLIIFTIIFWMIYNFLSTPRILKYCEKNDYLTLSEAVDAGYSRSNILTLSDSNQLLYRRILKNQGSCIPESDQTQIIKYPTYCLFKTTKNNIIEGTIISDGIGEYTTFGGLNVKTSENCVPFGKGTDAGELGIIVSGKPELK